MGIEKRKAEEKKAKKRTSPFERRQARYEQLAFAFVSSLPKFMECAEDFEAPFTGLTMKLMDHGGWLVIVKRESGLDKEMVMSGGEDFIEALMGAENKIARRNWQEDKPWNPENAKKG